MVHHLSTETGTIRKKWTGRLPIALIYPNTYPVAISNLGFQIVYSLLNNHEEVVCERFVYPSTPTEPFRSLESNRPLSDFPLVLGSVSFEKDYSNLVSLLLAGKIAPLTSERNDAIAPGSPLVILGGVAVFMNPEPLAPFADLMVIGEAEAILPGLLPELLRISEPGLKRDELLRSLATSLPGCYVPSLYSFQYGKDGEVLGITPEPGIPATVKKVIQSTTERAGHSHLFSPQAELDMFMAELGRGCSRGCRFCAAGYIYRPPRLWSADAILQSLEERPPAMEKIGLLGMEMASNQVLDTITNYLGTNSCALSFSSLRADRISPRVLELLSASELKSAAIAPDGCSERLRRVINKGLREEDLLAAALRLVEAGIFHLKLYVMIGLPTETEADLDELVALVKRIRQTILPVGKSRGRVSTLTLSINSFVPKPWTPFQYMSFGGMEPQVARESTDSAPAILALKRKIKHLRTGLASEPNVQINSDRPEGVLQQAVFARGDRRLAPVLLAMAGKRLSFKQAMKTRNLSDRDYAVRPRGLDEQFCWEILDHGIRREYLRLEYEKALAEKPTSPCETTVCKRCGVCNGSSDK